MTVVGELVGPADTGNSPLVSGDLLPTARLYAESHQHTHGEPITAGQLAVRMRITTTAAERLLRAINDTEYTTRRH